jgi:alpha-L-rhamnosidase
MAAFEVTTHGRFWVTAEGQTNIGSILLKDFDVTIKNDKLNTSGVTDLRFENVMVNGKPYSV